MSQLSPEQLERVARRAVRCRLADGQLLFSQADPFERFYLVLSGQMRLFRLSPEGAEKVIEITGKAKKRVADGLRTARSSGLKSSPKRSELPSLLCSRPPL